MNFQFYCCWFRITWNRNGMRNWIELQHSYRNLQKIVKDTRKVEYIKCDLYHKIHTKFDALNHSKAFNLLQIFAPSFLLISHQLLSLLLRPSSLLRSSLFVSSVCRSLLIRSSHLSSSILSFSIALKATPKNRDTENLRLTLRHYS